MSIEEITIKPQELLNTLTDYRESRMQRKIIFIVGSGCSREANIDTGEQLAKKWYGELAERLGEDGLQKWADACKIDTNDLGFSYTEIYKKRFELDPKIGFEFLTRLMERGQISAGHILLARLLAKKGDLNHRTIITTNFDHLVEQSVYAYTNRLPFICGHESLAAYANNSLDHPLIVKVHRDVHFNPLNQTNEVAELERGWHKMLNSIFDNSIVIVLGYGGNDGSLMNYLKGNNNITNIFWSVYGDTVPRQEIVEMVKEKKGRFVKHQGFSLLMISIAKGLDVDFEVDNVRAESDEKIKKFQDRIEELTKVVGTKGTPEEKKVIQNIAQEKIKTWWSAQMEINAEENYQKRDEMYLNALDKYPDSPQITGNYAGFLHSKLLDYDNAEKYYKKAIELDPAQAINNANYAWFLYSVRKNYQEAEKYYKKALELDPDDANCNANYATFLRVAKKDNINAEKFYKRVLELDPNHEHNVGNYATFLDRIKQDYISAERYYKKALELNPDHSVNNNSYAYYLENVRKDFVGADLYYKKALDLNPLSALSNYSYALFLRRTKNDFVQAEKYYKKALEIEPKNDEVNAGFAVFLHQDKKDYQKADTYYKKALEFKPNDAIWNGNYAGFLLGMGRNKDAENYYQKAKSSLDIPDDLNIELYFYQYAHLDDKEQASEKIEELLAQGARSEDWDFSLNVERAIADGHPDPERLRDLAHRISGLDYSAVGVKK